MSFYWSATQRRVFCLLASFSSNFANPVAECATKKYADEQILNLEYLRHAQKNLKCESKLSCTAGWERFLEGCIYAVACLVLQTQVLGHHVPRLETESSE